MEVRYASSVGRTSCSFRVTWTVLRRLFIAVRAAPVECFYQRQEHFSVYRSFFAFPDQYGLLGYHVSEASEGCFWSTTIMATHGILYSKSPDYWDSKSLPEPVLPPSAHLTRIPFHIPSRPPRAPRQPPQPIPYQSATPVPVPLDSFFRLSELVWAFPAHLDIFSSIHNSSKVLLTCLLACVDAELSQTLEVSNSASETGSYACESYI